MTRPPARVLLASALSAAVLLTATACSAIGSAAKSSGRTDPAASPAALTSAQAQAALITQADLGEAWFPTQGAATWRDGMLKATTEDPDCRRLLDTLYSEELFGPDAGTKATAGLDDTMNEAQLRYQVVTHRSADLDRSLAWLKTMPQQCAQFTATTDQGLVQDVQVTDMQLPAVGDARQGLRIELATETSDGEPFALTLEVAAVRVADDAIALTNGGLAGVSSDATQTAVQLGAQRLTEVRKQGRVQV
jgi:hypothetical protein